MYAQAQCLDVHKDREQPSLVIAFDINTYNIGTLNHFCLHNAVVVRLCKLLIIRYLLSG